MDPAFVQDIVLEQPAPCEDAADAEGMLKRMLEAERAPKPGWTLRMRVTKTAGEPPDAAPPGLHAEGEIKDETGASIAKRAFDHESSRCQGLARAVGVWAELVLDAERRRAEDEEAARRPPPPPPPFTPTTPGDTAVVPSRQGRMRQSLEAGGGSFVMGGTGAGALLGINLFLVIGSGGAWYVRPSLAFGKTMAPSQTQFDGWMGSIRLDGCGRAIGADLDRAEGWAFDVCGGGELGAHAYNATAGGQQSPAAKLLIVLGPSVSLKYALGNGLAFNVGVASGLNVDALLENGGTNAVQQYPVVVRGELGVSWQLE